MLFFRSQPFGPLRPFCAGLILIIGSLLSACGYRPLYDQRSNTDLTVIKQMALIEIQQIDNRIGQHLRNNLLVRLNPKGEPANPLYTLSVKLEEINSDLGVKKSAVVTRGNLQIYATFTLSRVSDTTTEIKSNKLLTSKVETISSYNIPQAQYASLAASKDAQTRALREIADNLRTRLGIYFRQSSE